MEKEKLCYQTYVAILKRELVVAMGCTEPIALAYCAAKARAVLGQIPDKVIVETSGNIIKNVKSVIVPNTNGEKGIESAVAIGIIAGDEKLELEVLSNVTEQQKKEFLKYKKTTKIQVKQAESDLLLDIIVKVYKGDSYAIVRIANAHSNVVYIEKDGDVLLDNGVVQQIQEDVPDYSLLSVQGIYDFAQTVDIEDVKEVLNKQIEYNSAIAEKG